MTGTIVFVSPKNPHYGLLAVKTTLPNGLTSKRCGWTENPTDKLKKGAVMEIPEDSYLDQEEFKEWHFE